MLCGASYQNKIAGGLDGGWKMENGGLRIEEDAMGKKVISA